MKDLEKLDDRIDRYYSEKLDASNSDELKLKEVLDTMSKLD